MKKILMCFAILMAYPILSVAGVEEWKQLQKGTYSLVVDQQFWVVRSPDGLKVFSKRTGMSAKQNLDAADFDKQMLVAIFYGQKPTGGYSIDVDSVEKTEFSIHINIRERKPSKDMMVTQAITSPFLFIMLPQSEKKVVVNYIE